jgi:hypothetical protein
MEENRVWSTRCPNRGVFGMTYNLQTLLALHLSCPDRTFSKGHRDIMQLMIRKGWTLNPICPRVIPPLTAFLVHQETVECEESVTAVLCFMAKNGARVGGRDALLLLAFAQPYLLVLSCQLGLVDLEDFVSITPKQVRDVLSGQYEDVFSGRVVQRVLTYLLLSSRTGVLNMHFSEVLAVVKTKLQKMYPDTDVWGTYLVVKRILDNASRPYSLTTQARNAWRRHLRSRGEVLPSGISDVPTVVKDLLFFPELDAKAVMAVVERDNFDELR